MTTRTGAYQALMEALRETVQTGSLQVLKQNFDKGIEDCLAIQNIHIDSDTTQICRRSAQESSTSTLFLEEVYCQFRLKYEKDQESIAKIRWIPSTAAPTRLSQLIPAGLEDLPSYVARAFHEGEWIPGKFIIGHDQVYRAYIPYYGKEYEYKDFQVLIAPPGATGWVETEPKHIPKLGVVGGFDPAIMEPTYICRVWYDGKLVVGKVLRNSENCFVPYHGKEIPLNTRFEVLVYNAHGIS